MQRDFHHSVVYVLARLAGFTHKDATIVSTSSQYVDDDIIDGILFFRTGEVYKCNCSAHKVVDYRNWNSLKDHYSWIPFHFLPGFSDSEEYKASKKISSFEKKMICRPNSMIAQKIVDECIRNNARRNALFRLGLSLHVYADTWAHQGFSGIESEVNRTVVSEKHENGKNLIEKLTDYFVESFDYKFGQFIDNVLPLGHGTVLTSPDLPYLKWSYTDYKGDVIKRDNTEIFIDAVKHIYIAMKKFINGSTSFNPEPIDEVQLSLIKDCFTEFTDCNAHARNRKWKTKIEEGVFSFGSADIVYEAPDWENEILNPSENHLGNNYSLKHLNTSHNKLVYPSDFMVLNWKLHKDAQVEYMYFLFRELLPEYGICLG